MFTWFNPRARSAAPRFIRKRENGASGSDGLVIIDLPQAVDAAGNNNAARMLERDVAKITAYFGRFAPELLTTDYGREIWKLYENGKLSPVTELTGRFERSGNLADVNGVMRDIDSARRWHELELTKAKNSAIPPANQLENEMGKMGFQVEKLAGNAKSRPTGNKTVKATFHAG